MQHHFPAHWSIDPSTAPVASHGHWANTAPAVFDALLDTRPSPFREALRGLQVRELVGEDVFQRYFSSKAN